MRKINIVLWGIGQHSVKKILPAITNCKSLNLYGLFSRNKKVLNKNKKKFKCKIWPNPDQMLKDSNIDVVYISTPIGLHFEQPKKILSFNKDYLKYYNNTNDNKIDIKTCNKWIKGHVIQTEVNFRYLFKKY